MTIAHLASQFAAGKASSRQRVEQALAAINDPAGEGARTFILVHEAEALADADRMDALRRRGAPVPPLAGVPISIKDNIDEAGRVTLAASRVLLGDPAAARDSLIVERLKRAGAVIIGRTNMTEFAYSGLGINPHYGTPKNRFDRMAARLPGGSSSGAAISVTDGMATAAIGTDTGGSVRIPAALNGLVGFKPTARRVPLDGVFPLSRTLDSAGPIAKTVADCVLLDQVLSADFTSLPQVQLSGLRFAVPQAVVNDDVSVEVADAFSAALTRLSAAGAQVSKLPMSEFSRATAVNPRGALTAFEAYARHAATLRTRADRYDPRVLSRMLPGADVSAAQYEEMLQARERFASDVESAVAGYDAMLMPTVPDTAPTIAEVAQDDASYFRWNARMLRGPSLVNLFDGCGLSIPCHLPGCAPVGLTITGTRNTDRRILAIGQAIEGIVAPDQ